MVEDAAAERYCVSFLQNLFYDSTISGGSWRGNSKILLHLHCIALQLNLLSELIRLDGAPQMTALVVKTRQNGWSLLDGAPLA